MHSRLHGMWHPRDPDGPTLRISSPWLKLGPSCVGRTEKPGLARGDRMRRRDCTRIVLGTVAAWPFVVGAQDPRVRRIAVLMAIREDFEGQQRVAALRESLRRFGWSEDHNLRIEVHWLGGDADELKPKVQQVLAHLPDVIVVNGTPGLSAVRAITNSVPTVFVIVADPVGAGFVQTLSRPGGNITGFSTFEPEI